MKNNKEVCNDFKTSLSEMEKQLKGKSKPSGADKITEMALFIKDTFEKHKDFDGRNEIKTLLELLDIACRYIKKLETINARTLKAQDELIKF